MVFVSYKRNVVLDTSIFVNPDVRGVLGNTPTLALQEFLILAQQAEGMEFFMPPSIFEELMNFVKREDIPSELLLRLNQVRITLLKGILQQEI